MDYETISAQYVEYRKNKFIEIAKKKIASEDVVFINISKGYVTPTGVKRYQKSIGFPPEEDIVTGIIEKLGQIWGEVSQEERDAANAQAQEAMSQQQAPQPAPESSPEPAQEEPQPVSQESSEEELDD